jgi:diguanylate cyclase (GGDEF)-like protein/PAS domain S-box-containing protein
MKVQTKFGVLVLLIALCSAGWMYFSRLMEEHQYNHWLNTQHALQNENLSSLLSKNFQDFQHRSIDLTFGNDLSLFAQGKLPRSWAENRLAARSRENQIDGVWVYRQDATLLYAVSGEGKSLEWREYLPHSWIGKIQANPQGLLSFASTRQGIIMVTAIPLVVAGKPETAPAGYLVTGKLLDANYLQQLGRQWQGDITLYPWPSQPAISSTDRGKPRKLVYYRRLEGMDTPPLAVLEARSYLPQVLGSNVEFNRVLEYTFYYFLIIFLVITGIFYRNLYKPLKTLEESLAHKNTSVLSPLLKARDEFGVIARLIRGYFEKDEKLDEELNFRQQLLDSIPLPVFYKDIEGRYRGCNKAFETFFAKDREVILGLKCRDFYEKAIAEVHEAADKKLLEEKEEQVYHQVIKTGENEFKDFIFTKAIYHDREGNPLGIIGTAYDITDRKRAEEILEWEVRINSELIDLAKSYLGSMSLETASALLVKKARQLTGSICGYIGFVDRNSGELLFPCIDKGEESAPAEVPGFFQSPLSLWQWAITHKAPLLVNNLEDLPAGFKESVSPEGIKRLLSLPVYVEDSLQGLLVLANAEENYTGRDLVIAERLMTLYTLAIQRFQTENRLKTSETHLRQANRALFDLIEFLPDPTFVVNKEGIVTQWNRAIEELTGIAKEDILGKGNEAYSMPFYGRERPLLVNVILDRELEQTAGYVIEKRGNTIDTEFFCPLLYQNKGAYLWATAAPLFDSEGRVIGAIESIRDITERKKFEEKLREAAFHDPLTGLPNRALFMPRLEQCLARARRHSDYMFAVLFLDLDRFKDINDRHGHLAGDRMLVEVGVRLKKCVREVDTVARLGGDEFVILMEDITQPLDATRVAERILQEFGEPVIHEEKEIFMDTSIGVLLSIDERSRYRNTDDLFRDADMALYQAKESGRCRYALFDSHMQESIRSMLELEADLKKALHGGEFELRYQPILRLEDYSVKGFEALVYWRHPDKGIIPPRKFIPIAEDIGLIIPLGEWIIREACRQLLCWKKINHENPVYVSVNISLSQVEHHNFLKTLNGIMRETGLTPAELQLEINETTLIDNPIRLRPLLMDLRTEGYRLLLDNFGTGDSSIGYLIQLPVETLKIDKEYIFSIPDEEASRELVKVILSLTETLKLDVIAEGVETPAQLNFLKETGCQYAQGFFFAKPMAPHETEEYYRNSL